MAWHGMACAEVWMNRCGGCAWKEERHGRLGEGVRWVDGKI